MERYNSCSTLQKKVLDEMYVYLGFNERLSFEDFIKFMFYNSTANISFDNIINHTLSLIVKSFWSAYPEYKHNYIKYLWLRTEDMLDHFKVGAKKEYDPKGVLRYYIVNCYQFILSR